MQPALPQRASSLLGGKLISMDYAQKPQVPANAVIATLACAEQRDVVTPR